MCVVWSDVCVHVTAIMPLSRKRYCNLHRCKVEQTRHDGHLTLWQASTGTIGKFIWSQWRALMRVNTIQATVHFCEFIILRNENAAKSRWRENIEIQCSCRRSCIMFSCYECFLNSILDLEFTESSDVMLSCHRFWFIELFFFSFFLRCSPRKSSSSAPHDWFSCKASQFGAKIMHFAYISFQIWSSMTSTRSHRCVFLLLPHEIAIAVFIIITFIRNDWNARNIFISSYTYIIWAEHWAGVCAPSYFTFLVLPDFFLVLPRYLFCSQIRNVSSICCAKN